jgi:transposase
MLHPVAYRHCEVGMMVRLQPRKAHDRVVAAYAATGGNEVQAAARLGVALSTLKRWVALLERQGLQVRQHVTKARKAARKERGDGQGAAAGQ